MTLIFNALHGMQTRFSNDKVIYPSVRLSVSLCENCQRQRCKAFIGLTTRTKNWWGRPLSPEISGQSDRVGAKSPIFDLQCVSKKTSPTFLAVTLESIVGFS